MDTLKTFAENMASAGLICFVCMILFACAHVPEKAPTPFGERTLDNTSLLKACSLAPEDRPESYLGRSLEGQCNDV